MAKVLVVDDEPPLRELMRATLEPEHEVTEAADADEAVAACLSTRPDLVLLDVMLPGASGIDVLRRIRDDDATARTGVVIVSAWDAEADRRRAADEGADAFVGKPFLPEDLLAAVERVLAEARR
ncbi:MAG TPA: response regulator [Gaiellaceae bacterium]|nr:response regulator [Gaiellaceae bacterium]